MELDIFSQGKEYISASRAAKKTGYSSDYIGQLCRAGKVPGKLIDRSWYVDLDSLLAHKRTRQLGKPRRSVSSSSTPSPKESELLKIQAEPVEIFPLAPLRDLNVNIVPDEAPLLPHIVKAVCEPKPTLLSEFSQVGRYAMLTFSLVLAVSGFLLVDSVTQGSRIASRVSAQNPLSQVAAASFFNSLSDSVEFLTAGFKNLRELALGQGQKSTTTEPSVGTRMKVTLATVSSTSSTEAPTSEALTQAVHPLASSSLKSELRDELQAYIRTQVLSLASPEPRITYTPSTSSGQATIILRNEILTTDTRPTVTRQSTSDVDHTTVALERITHSGSFVNPTITGASITDATGVFNHLTFDLLEGTSATSTNFFATTASSTNLFATTGAIGTLSANSLSVGGISGGSTSLSDLFVSGSSTLQNFTFVNATGTQATTTNFFATRGTLDELYVNDYQQNDGTFVINSTVPTGDIFTVNDAAITNGTLIHQTLTANAGNGQVSKGQIIDLTDNTTAGGGYSALTINVSGSGVGSGSKTLLSLNPGGNNEVVFDSTGALRPTTSVASNTNTIGSASFYFKNGYFDTITANNLSGTVVTGATSNDTWTIGSTEASDNLKALIFQRNSGSGNATLSWDAGANDLRYLSVNYPFNATYTVSDTSISTTANLYSGILTNNTTSGTQKLLSLTNTGTGTTENGIYINNTGTGTTAFEIAGTWTNGIVTNNNSIDAGSGNITTTGTLSVGSLALTGSTTLQNLTFVNATGTNATTTNSFATTASSTNLYSSLLTVGGSALKVVPGGNVGIGTTNPLRTLSVLGGAIVRSSANTDGGAIRLGDTGGLITGETTGGLSFRVGSNDSSTIRMAIDSTGNVGIGTSSPNSLLSVRSGNASTVVNTGAAQFGVSPGSSSAGIELGTYTGGYGMVQGVTFTTGTAASIQINPFGGNILMAGNGSTGNVGIGTTNPINKLQVLGDVKLATAALGTVALNFGTSGTDFQRIQYDDTTGKLAIGNPTSSNGYALLLQPFSGNVGIGTTNPATGLDVQTGTTANGQLRLGTSSQAGSISFRRGTDGSTAANIGWLSATNDTTFQIQNNSGSGELRLGANASGGFLTLYTTTNGGSNGERLRIDPNGNIGIGVTNPDVKLSIRGADNGLTDGKIKIKSNKTGWGDITSQLQTTAGGTTATDNLNISIDSGYITLSPGGGTAMTLLHGGNVGIGLTNPGARFDVKSSATGSNVLQVTNTTGAVISSIYNGANGSGYIYANDSTGNNKAQIAGNDVSYFMGGNVGVGTTTPARRFQVTDSSGTWARFDNGDYASSGRGVDFFEQRDSVGTFSGLRVRDGLNDTYFTVGDSFGGASGVGGSTLSAANWVASRGAQVSLGANVATAGSNFGYITFVNDTTNSGKRAGAQITAIAEDTSREATALALFTNATPSSTYPSERMRITSVGNVGIGTTTPLTKLVVSQTGEAPLFLDRTETTGSRSLLKLQRAGATKGEIGLVSNDNLYLSGAEGAQHLVINSSGNVGIGTTNPGSALEVNGDIGYAAGSALYPRGKSTVDWYLGKYNSNIDTSVGQSGDRAFRIGFDPTGSALTVNVKLSGGGGFSSYINLGNVGIGTTTPTAKLQVTGTSGLGDIFTIASSTNTNLLTFTAAGNLGIGTTNPSSPLQISSLSTTPIFWRVPSDVDNTYNVIDALGGSSSSVGILLRDLNGKSVRMYHSRSGGTGMNYAFDGSAIPAIIMKSSSVTLGDTAGNNSEKMIIYSKSNGGTATQLELRNDTNATDSGARILFGTASGSNTAGDMASIQAVKANGTGNNITTYLAFSTINDSTSLTEQLRITGSGNLGVGTTTPGKKLEVNGSVAVGTSNQGYYFTDSAGTQNSYIYKYGADNRISIGNSSTAGGAGSDYLTVAMGGNVGIGTTNPSALLSISNASASKLNLLIGASERAYMDYTEASSLLRIDSDGGISLQANNTDAVRILSGGNVGIGTTTPRNKFMVEGATSELAQFYNTTAGGSAWSLYAGDNGTTIPAGSFGIGPFGSTANAKLTINSSGNVGIGTTTPGSLLQVGGTAAADTSLTISSGSSNWGNLLFTDGTSRGGISVEDTDNMFFYTGGTAAANKRVVFTSTGNVGVGTTSPSNKLHVYSTSNTGGISVDGTNQPTLSLQSNNTDRLYLSAVTSTNGIITGSAANDIAFRSTAGNILFSTDNGSTAQLYLKNNGNVAIGTTSPSSKLHIDGSHPAITLSSSPTTSSYWTLQTGDVSEGDLSLRAGAVGSGTSGLYIKSAGNVGIGTTAPGDRLSVSGILGVYGNGSATGNGLRLYTQSLANWATIAVGGATTNNGVSISTDVANAFYVAQAGNVGIGTTTPTAKLQITGTSGTSDIFTIASSTNMNLLTVNAAGNIGIGTSAPQYKVHAYDSTDVRIGAQTTSNSTAAILQAVADTASFSIATRSSAAGGTTFAGLSGNNQVTLEANTASSLYIGTVNSGTAPIVFAPARTEMMRITSTGNVGIGTTNPLLTPVTSGDKGLSIYNSTGNRAAVLELIGNNSSNYGTGNPTGALTFSNNEGGGSFDELAQIRGFATNTDDDTGALSFLTATNGTLTERMYIDYTGNVGIGTTTPSDKLHVAGNIRSSAASSGDTWGMYLKSHLGTSVGKWEIGGSETNHSMTFGVVSNNYLSLITNNTERLKIGNSGDFTFNTNQAFLQQTSGNFGVGTTTPWSKFTVVGNSDTLTTSVSSGARLQFGDTSTATAYMEVGGYNSVNNIDTKTRNLRIFSTSDTTGLTYLATGNFGIGTTNPGKLLTVGTDTTTGSTIRIDGVENTANSSTSIFNPTFVGMQIINRSSTVNAVSGISLAVGANANSVAGLAAVQEVNNSLAALAFYTGGAGRSNTTPERMRIDSNGNVGIGTTTSAALLSLAADTTSSPLALADLNNLRSGSTSENMMRFMRLGTIVGSIQSTDTTTAYNTTSDERLKTNIVETHFSLDDLMGIEVKDYTFRKDTTSIQHTGFLAQQLNTKYAEAVSVGGANPDTQPWAVDYGKLTPLIVKSIQDIVHITGSFKDSLIAWMGDAANGIEKLFAKEVHTEKLCVKKSDGTEVCVTGDELALALTATGQTPSDGGSMGETTFSEPEIVGGDTGTSTPETIGETGSSTPESISDNGTGSSTSEVISTEEETGSSTPEVISLN